MSDVTPTGYKEVVTMFHSMPKTRDIIADKLEQQYFNAALAEYELNVGELGYDAKTGKFSDKQPYAVVYTLALLMYVSYLRQELSRTLKLNGMSGKDISLTGIPAAKQYTSVELQNEIEHTRMLIYKQMTHAYL